MFYEKYYDGGDKREPGSLTNMKATFHHNHVSEKSLYKTKSTSPDVFQQSSNISSISSFFQPDNDHD